MEKNNIENTKPNSELLSFTKFSDKVIFTDQFGFICEVDDKKNNKEIEKSTLLRENARTEKWNIMFQNFDEFYKNKFSKLKERTRKGIPDCVRGIAWMQFAKIGKFFEKSENIGLFEKLSLSDKIEKEVECEILRDINRTFPKNVLFKDKFGEGQQKLYSVLRAYSIYNNKVGYVQGMGFVAALFLTYMDEEKVFWMIHSLMSNYNMQELYISNFPGLKSGFYILLSLMKKYLSKVYNHLKHLQIYPSMYSSQWFMTVFCNCLKFNILVRFMDTFLLEGDKVIYRFALAILKINQEKLLHCKSFEDGLMSFKDFYKNINEENIISTAFDFGFVRKDIESYKNKYESNLKTPDPKDEIMEQCVF
jgi:hypothetical protein